MDYEDLGYQIRLRRKQLGWNLTDLAERAHISASFMGHIERGTRALSLDTFVAICNALQVSPSTLLQSYLTPPLDPPGVTLEEHQLLLKIFRMLRACLEK